MNGPPATLRGRAATQDDMTSEHETPDRHLVTRFLTHRDEEIFRELYRRHTPALYLMALRLLGGSGKGAEDAVQETWIRAVRGLSGFRWEASLRTWLTGIAIRTCREALRNAGPAGRLTGDEAAPGGAVAPPGPGVIDMERAVRSLPDGAREVLVLHDIEGLTHEEIGERLGIQAGTSKSQLHKARRALRILLLDARSGTERTS